MSEEFTRVYEIDIDDLGVDECNIRGGDWDQNEEFIESVRENGVIEPLIVRSADPSTGVKYAIVSGSRRYNASIIAGLTTVPCIIRELTDIEASALSILENRHRKDIADWVYAVKLGELFEVLKGVKDRDGTINFLSKKTGVSKKALDEYLMIFDLPEEVFILLKKPEERTKEEVELFKKYHTAELPNLLTKDKAVLISRELKSYPIERQVEIAKEIVSKSRKVAQEVIRLAKTYPKESMEQIMDKFYSIPRGARWQFYFESMIVTAIDDACIRKKVDRTSLIHEYIKQGLIRDGFL